MRPIIGSNPGFINGKEALLLSVGRRPVFIDVGTSKHTKR
jgi:hypothetical protein